MSVSWFSLCLLDCLVHSGSGFFGGSESDTKSSSLVSCIVSSLQIVDSYSKFLLKYLAQTLH